MFDFKKLHPTDISDNMLDTFTRYQATNKVLVNESGNLVEKEDRFEDDWLFNRKREIVIHFNYVLNHGGAVIIVTRETSVVGFAVIEPGKFGHKFRYRELSYIHVSSELRGNGIGHELFKKMLEVTKELGAEKLYIGAHPSIETQRFYSKMGCELGEFNVDGTINNGEAEFSAGIENDFSVGSIGLGEGFPEIKDACLDETCNY